MGINSINLKCDENGIYYFGDYIPKYMGGTNDEFSKMVLGVKTMKKDAIDFFSEVLGEYFWACLKDSESYNYDYKIMDYGTLTTHVPSSTSGKTDTGMNYLLNRVINEVCHIGRHYFNSPKAFIRHKSIVSAHSGGTRAIKVHLESILMDTNAKADHPEGISPFVPNYFRISDFTDEKHFIDEGYYGKLLIIDDVTTSGSSLLACRKIAIRNGFRDISLLALGKTPR